jgi:hypothetical protein
MHYNGDDMLRAVLEIAFFSVDKNLNMNYKLFKLHIAAA